jgi:parallel beta-helix repeat protein
MLVSVILILAAIGNGVQNDAPNLVAGVKVAQRATFKPGEYRHADNGGGVIQVSGRDFTLDLRGVKLIGPGKREGVGIHVTDARNVTIKNADVRGYRWGILLERCVEVKLEDSNFSRNGNLPPGTAIDESGKEPEDQHGGGILIRDSKKCSVKRCKAMYQWDGVDVVRSDENTIEDGDYSYNNNWGVHFWAASRNVFRRNRAIWCTTGQGELFQALTGWQTYDAQAVAMDHNSNENRIEENDLRFGGDAIFIRANEGPLDPSSGMATPVKNGSHRNILRNNDCSFSPNNAIEVDFVDDTVIEGNNCSYSNYGMWLGYSRGTIVRGNIAVNCSSRAVEIENGQNGVFENNYFASGSATGAHLIYLRQNGRDKTPSGPYRFVNNFLWGSYRGILLRHTPATFERNTLYWILRPNDKEAVLVEGDSESQFTLVNNVIAAPETPLDVIDPRLHNYNKSETKTIRVGALNTIRVEEIVNAPWAPLVTIEGIPVWVRKYDKRSVTFWMPEDFWDRPAPGSARLNRAEVNIFNGKKKRARYSFEIEWPKDRVQVTEVSPNPARLGDTITVKGVNLIKPQEKPVARVLLNGKSVELLEASPESLKFRLPEGILLPTRYNLIVEQGAKGEEAARSWPIVFGVQVPSEQQPHIVNAEFSPQRLKVGELLKVTFTVRNNLPHAAPVMQILSLPVLSGTSVRGYEEKQAHWQLGIEEKPGTLHLRVTSDKPGPHHPGSWPYMFGFEKASLAPGETTTVTGYIRVQTPGTIEFRVGLVASGFRFIDDNAFRTKIEVLP